MDMTPPVQEYEALRASYIVKLVEINQELEAERARLATAAGDRRERLDSLEAMRQFTKDRLLKNLSNKALPMPLHSGLVEIEERLKPSGDYGAALAKVASLEEQAAGLRDSIAYIDVALTANKVTELRPNVAPSRRKPAPVDFDNISIANR
jgi:hypothetical protein